MKTLNQFLNESKELDEAYMHDVQKLNVGDTIHPFRNSAYNINYQDPHTIVKKLASKTVLQNSNTGHKYDVSHSTGKVKNQETGSEQKYNFEGFHSTSEKNEVEARKQKQRDKDNAHDAIAKHLAGGKNGMGHFVGKLSDEAHKEILAHLEKLKE